MKRIPAIMLSMLAAVSAQAGRAQESETAPSEALVERFVTALPEARSLAEPLPLDPAEVGRLSERNPGRAADVRSLLTAHNACLAPVVRTATLEMLRRIGRGLGEAKLSRLVEFYEGGDYRTFAALQDRADGGETLSGPEVAEMARLIASYPLIDFFEGMEAAQQDILQDQEFVTEVTRCALEQRSAFARAGLRAN